MHKCYLPENAGKLKQLRELEAKQRRGELKQMAFLNLIALKKQLGIGI